MKNTTKKSQIKGVVKFITPVPYVHLRLVKKDGGEQDPDLVVVSLEQLMKAQEKLDTLATEVREEAYKKGAKHQEVIDNIELGKVREQCKKEMVDILEKYECKFSDKVHKEANGQCHVGRALSDILEQLQKGKEE